MMMNKVFEKNKILFLFSFKGNPKQKHQIPLPLLRLIEAVKLVLKYGEIYQEEVVIY